MLAFISRLTQKEQFFEKISLGLLVILLLLTPLVYSSVPEKILMLNSKAGALEEYSSKSALWSFPIIGIVIYAALSILKRYLIKYREMPAKGEEPEHATTVWVLRLVKMIALAGLIVTVFEVLVASSEKGTVAATVGFIAELVIVIVIFAIVIKEVIAKYANT